MSPGGKREAGSLGELFSPGDAVATSAAIASGRLRCIDAVEACLSRAAATEPVVHAFLHLDPAAALREAEERDRELAAGYRRSALHGIPVAVKDIIDVAGMPTTAASRVVAATPAARDAEIVAALRVAGGVIIGKTNTHEFANGATTPPTRNPRNVERIAGGSSGGSAAAIAAGSALLTIGTDTGGSVRLPAALCGVAGFRPRRRSNGIGLGGILPLSTEFDQWGLLAAHGADLVLACDALSITIPAPIPALSELRLIIPDRLSALLHGHEQDVLNVFAAAIAKVASAGGRVGEAAVPELAAWRAPRMAIQMRQFIEAHRAAGWWPNARDRYTDEVRLNLDLAERQCGMPLEGCRSDLEKLDAMVDALLAAGHLLALPTVAVTAPKASDVASMAWSGDETRHPIVALLAQATLPFSRPGLAAITISCGNVANGLSVGLQLVGTDDRLVLGAATAIEATLALRPAQTAVHA
jgi:aspartyl-tRNA(Asn)/glutamyl-tRNA(Gln) amidotransferase subunit A